MQSDNRFFDDLAKLASGLTGAAVSAREEMESAMRAWFDRRLATLELVRREEFEAVREMAAKAREENERLAKRVATLEAARKSPSKAARTKAVKASKPAKAPPARPKS